jgi:hypothetical protein
MRPNQQNNNNKNRSRGRNGGRKHVNPLSRSFESNGPDVKVRGNAPHIAEKYMQLARDAQSSGDSVMAENYLQHAEHYFRIVSAAQPNASREDGDDFDDDMPEINSRFSSPQPANSQQNDGDEGGEQPYQSQQPQQQNNGQERQDRAERQERQPRPDRPSAEERAKAQQLAREQAAAAAAEAAAAQEASPVAEAAPVAAADGEAEGEPRKVRERRPRRRRPAGGDAGVDAAGEQPDVGDLPAFITAGGGTPAE